MPPCSVTGRNGIASFLKHTAELLKAISELLNRIASFLTRISEWSESVSEPPNDTFELLPYQITGRNGISEFLNQISDLLINISELLMWISNLLNDDSFFLLGFRTC